ncbi:MAG: calcineurin-like phosphoesterase family protein [Rikenellaceae bacterium]|nr:calcineurin-like phosphoesterase family protein [Rikenellaceae bacterium]
MKNRIISYCLRTAALLLVACTAVAATACSDDKEKEEYRSPERFVKDLLLPGYLKVYAGQEITVQGKGFQLSDVIIIDNYDGNTYSVALTEADDRSATFAIPDDFKQSTYSISLTRGGETQILGTTLFLLTRRIEVPDREGATLKGAVYCGDRGVEGVIVSDGYLFTRTDRDGFYWLESAKKNGNVFIVMPSGYEVTVLDAVPYYWSILMSKATDGVEQHNFELFEADNTNHIMVAAADMHLVNRNNAIEQYEGGFEEDVRTLYQRIPDRKVYSIFLGDLSWETYWYTSYFTITEFRNRLSGFPVTVFPVMGNHDNDPAYSDDFECEERYRQEFGPTYYAFDLGEVHYVVLDNIEYLNTTDNPRGYNVKVTSNQIAWLKEYLSMLGDKTQPLVVAMHAQMYRRTGPNPENNAVSMSNAAELEACFDGFTDVHIWTGHTHRNYTVERTPNIMEHNTAAVSATWWWTGVLSGNSVCPDGSWGGYGVYDFTGRNVEWYYKSIGYPKEKQFCAYDMNRVKDYFANDSHARKYFSFEVNRLKENYGSNGTYPQNSVMINIFNWDSGWDLKVYENGTLLPDENITHRFVPDPLHTASYNIPRSIDTNGSPTADFETYENNPHMFIVETSGAGTPVRIEVTDRFGNVYTEDMARPKAFSVDMQ